MAKTGVKNILIADDDDSIRWIINELLEDLGYSVEQTNSAEAALEKLQNNNYHLLITDLKMSGKSGMALLIHCQSIQPAIPVIMVTAHADLDSTIQAYQEGVFEYLPKPFDLDELSAIVKRALATRQPHHLAQAKNARKYAIIGEAPAMQHLYRAIGRLSNSQVTVLIQGESGTGKELVAHAIHQSSVRKDKPFVALNMAAIPKDLIESELFGSEKGAYTGATEKRLGRFEQADQGTLFLDEIGDMPIEAQTRLLRVLSEGMFYRVGATRATRVDVRIITATHHNLSEKVNRGEFREDLYHRLNVVPLSLPALRERKQDIPLLVEFFLAQIGKELQEPVKHFCDQAISKLQEYAWPGNVRQLENLCRRLSVMVNSQTILLQDLPAELLGRVNKNQTNDPESWQQQSWQQQSWQQQFCQQSINAYRNGDNQVFMRCQAEFEQSLIKTALKASDGKKADAAKLLGWGRNTLTRKLKD